MSMEDWACEVIAARSTHPTSDSSPSSYIMYTSTYYDGVQIAVETMKQILTVKAITPTSFAPFGSIIDRKLIFGSSNLPRTSALDQDLSNVKKLPPKASWANQGSAIKFADASHITNFYSESQSIETCRAIMTLFVCKPRPLYSGNHQYDEKQIDVSYSHSLSAAIARKCDTSARYLDLTVLERHPYTSQTFIPMGLQASNTSTVYLVVVAPTLPSSFPNNSDKSSNDHEIDKGYTAIQGRAVREPDISSTGPPAPDSPHFARKGSGPPDLGKLQAFIVDGDTAVTYAAGTWHAPMVVLGTKSVDFVVMQFANGVPNDDCQEINISGEEIAVEIATPRPGRSKL